MKINNLSELEREKARTRLQIEILEEQIKLDFKEIKSDLNPIHLIKDGVHNLFSSNKEGVINESIGITINTLIKNLFFRKSGFFTKTLIAFVVRNFVKSKVAKNPMGVKEWIGTLANKQHTPSHNGHHYDRSTSATDLDN